MKVKSIILILIIIVMCLFSLTGCYSSEGLENLAYAVAIGIDKGEDNKIKFSLQFAILSDSSQGSGGSSQSQKSTVKSIDCQSIDSGISLINSYIGKKVNLSHCKAIVISEELACEGISEYIFTFVNSLEIRPDCNVIISRCNASDYLENSEPSLDSASARYYKFTLNSSEYTGYSEDVTLSDLYSHILSNTGEAHAILGGVNVKSTHLQNSNIPNYDIGGNYKADQTPIKSGTGIENVGLAIFNNDKLVGELTAMESLCHLLIVNKLKSATISIPSPFDSTSVISLYITSNKKSKTKVQLINGTPYIECNISVTATILSLDDNMDYSSENNLRLIEDYANSYLEQNISSYLYKTAKDYKSDIANFGKHLIKNYSTWSYWVESDWLNNYENSFFSVHVDTTVQSGQLFTKV